MVVSGESMMCTEPLGVHPKKLPPKSVEKSATGDGENGLLFGCFFRVVRKGHLANINPE